MNDRYYTVLFVSRKKDNNSIDGFTRRVKDYLVKVPENVFDCDMYEFIANKFDTKFKDFVSKGLIGEVSRFYISVNERNAERAKKQFACELIMNDDFNIENIQNKFLGILNKPENAKTRRWMFDFDAANPTLLTDFVTDVCYFGNFDTSEILKYRTLHGYHVIVPNGFNTVELLNKWKDTAELKRDDMLFLKSELNVK